MSDSEGFNFEATTRQAVALAGFFGLILGVSIGITAGALAFQGPADSSDEEVEKVDMEGIELDNEPSLGDEDAPIKIIEYSDFGCPWCAEFQGVDAIPKAPIDRWEVSQKLEKEYVETGQVEFIKKDVPSHENAPQAHRMANCVYDQSDESDYWNYYERIYENRKNWMAAYGNDTEGTFRSISNSLGLETESLMDCYSTANGSEALEDRVSAGKKFGRIGTPTFFIGNEEYGFVELSGAQPFERFEEEINKIQNS